MNSAPGAGHQKKKKKRRRKPSKTQTKWSLSLQSPFVNSFLYTHIYAFAPTNKLTSKKKKKTINYGKGKVKVEMNLVGRCFTYKYIFMDCLVILF